MIDMTVVIPTYKRPDRLRRCLESVYASAPKNIQAIVVDDCPDCSGFEAARDFPATYVAKRGRRRGIARSRNIGIMLSEGKYLAFLDDDDYFVPGGIDVMCDAIAASPDFVFFDFITFDGSQFAQVNTDQTDKESLLVVNSIPVGAYAISRGAIQRMFDDNLSSHEDWNFLLDNASNLELVHEKSAIVVIDKTQGAGQSHSSAMRQRWWIDFLAIYARYPAPEMNLRRAEMLKSIGLGIPEELLATNRCYRS